MFVIAISQSDTNIIDLFQTQCKDISWNILISTTKQIVWEDQKKKKK